MGIISSVIEGIRIGLRMAGSTAGSILYIDSNNQIAEDNTNLSYDDSSKEITLGTGYVFGDGDSSIYEEADDDIIIKLGGTERFKISDNVFSGYLTSGAGILNRTPSATTTSIVPRRNNAATGIGSPAADQLTIIAGNLEGYRLSETSAGNISLDTIITSKLGQATGDETALTLNYETNKATSGSDTGLLINFTDTASPGVSRFLDMKVGGSSKFAMTNQGALVISGGEVLTDDTVKTYTNDVTMSLQPRSFTSADISIDAATGTFSNSSGAGIALAVQPTYNQSGTAAGTDLLINRTETATGSGDQNLIDAQIGGSSRFAIRKTSTSGETFLMIYDVDNGTMERVSVGAADSGGAGYKVLRIPN